MSQENQSGRPEGASEENTNTESRKTRNFMNFEKVEIMRRMIRRGATTKQIATDLNISESSARNYKRKIEEGQSVLIFPKRKKENRQREELSSMITQVVSNNNSVTLGGIQSHLQEHGITRSVSSICKILKEESFKRKRVQKVPLERDSPGNWTWVKEKNVLPP